MGFSKDNLLARLQELQIDYSKYEHPPVLTVEEQAKYVSSSEGALSKNLFLKDKKNRYYIVSAMVDTKVDMKVLSQRLGLGKGGIRMAPEEALAELLQVSLGCVTPFAVVNESARDVSLLLDQKFKNQTRCIFHPLSNDVSISLNTSGLDKFLQSIGRDSVYVDLEANPVVGKDQPPDLAVYVPSNSVVLPELSNKTASIQTPSKNVSAEKTKPVAASAKPSKPAGNVKSAVENSALLVFKTPGNFVEEILNKTSALLLSEVKGENVEALTETLRKRLASEFTHLAVMYKNTAYSEGFYAGKHSQPKPQERVKNGGRRFRQSVVVASFTSSAGFNTDQLPFSTSPNSENFSDEEAEVDPQVITDEPDEPEDEEDGEDLFNDNFLQDKQDQYESAGLDDSVNHDRDSGQIALDRRAAEAALDARECFVDSDDCNYRPSKRARPAVPPRDNGRYDSYGNPSSPGTSQPDVSMTDQTDDYQDEVSILPSKRVQEQCLLDDFQDTRKLSCRMTLLTVLVLEKKLSGPSSMAVRDFMIFVPLRSADGTILIHPQFSELKTVRYINFVVTRLFRFGEARNVKKGGELIDIHHLTSPSQPLTFKTVASHHGEAYSHPNPYQERAQEDAKRSRSVVQWMTIRKKKIMICIVYLRRSHC
ncbi:YbaK/aminoacyl-tRNA synthetase-associated domain-containing protein [Hirschfeldia incana]|nr:YbaK/aminoacyl-tRNA synthetase-associated domain-containing protein [Hirschfeldia incana]